MIIYPLGRRSVAPTRRLPATGHRQRTAQMARRRASSPNAASVDTHRQRAGSNRPAFPASSPHRSPRPGNIGQPADDGPLASTWLQIYQFSALIDPRRPGAPRSCGSRSACGGRVYRCGRFRSSWRGEGTSRPAANPSRPLPSRGWRRQGDKCRRRGTARGRTVVT